MIGRFLVRAVGVLLIAGGVGTWFAYRSWGIESVYLMVWSSFLALLMGVISYRASLRGILHGTSMTQVMGALLGGMALCVGVLLVGSGAVWGVSDTAWAQRALLSSFGLYLLLIFVKAFTLQGELTRALQGSRKPKPQGTSAPNAERES